MPTEDHPLTEAPSLSPSLSSKTTPSTPSSLATSQSTPPGSSPVTAMHLKSRALSDASVMLKDGDLTDEQYQNILLAHNQFNEAMQPPEPEIEIDDESPSLTGTSSTVSNASSNSSPGRKKSLSLFSLLPNSLLPTSLQTMSLHATPPPAPTRTSLAIAEATKARTRLLRKKNKLDQARATAITTDTQTWSQTVLPTWSPTAITSPLVRDLCLRGIPPKVRGPAWSHLIGNALCITPDLWTIHHSRGNRLMESVVAGSSKVGEEVAGSEWRGRDIGEWVDVERASTDKPLRTCQEQYAKKDKPRRTSREEQADHNKPHATL